MFSFVVKNVSSALDCQRLAIVQVIVRQMDGLGNAGGGWLPSSVRKVTAGRGAPAKSARIVLACKQCKKAKAKCDMSRPCRRCLYKGTQDECNAGAGDRDAPSHIASPHGSSAGEPPPLPKQNVPAFSSSLPSSRPASSCAAGAAGSATASARTGHSPRAGESLQQDTLGSGSGAEECFAVSLPGLQVLSVSPALSYRYRMAFAGPSETSLLLWIHQDDTREIVESMLSAAAAHGDQVVNTHPARLLVLRYSFAELHSCVLRVKAMSSTCVSLHVSWNSSMQEWEQAMEQPAQNRTLPAPIAKRIREKMEATLVGRSFSFDELRSTCCLYDYATRVSRSNGSGESSTLAIINQIATSDQSRALLQDWVGLRSASKFITRLIEIAFSPVEDPGTNATDSGPDSVGAAPLAMSQSAGSIYDINCQVRLKLPAMLGGLATPWLRLGRFCLQGDPVLPSCTQAERLSTTFLVDCTVMDLVGLSYRFLFRPRSLFLARALSFSRALSNFSTLHP